MNVYVISIFLLLIQCLRASVRIGLMSPIEFAYKTVFPTRHKGAAFTILLFSVKACKDAHVGLLAEIRPRKDWLVRNIWRVRNVTFYELALGAWANTRSVLRTDRGEAVVDNHYGEVLKCQFFKNFWLRFNYKGHVDVGFGHDVGRHVFLSYRGPVVIDINYVAISTGYGANGEWFLEKCLRKDHVRIAQTCYVIEKPRKWQDAKRQCLKLSGFLAEPRTKKENNMLKMYLSWKYKSASATGIWIGVCRSSKTLQLHYLQGGRNLTFTDFKQPHKITRKCVGYFMHFWENFNCHKRLMSLCQYTSCPNFCPQHGLKKPRRTSTTTTTTSTTLYWQPTPTVPFTSTLMTNEVPLTTTTSTVTSKQTTRLMLLNSTVDFKTGTEGKDISYIQSTRQSSSVKQTAFCSSGTTFLLSCCAIWSVIRYFAL